MKSIEIKKILFLTLFFLIVFSVYGQQSVTSRFEGRWRADTGEGIIGEFVFNNRNFELLQDGRFIYRGTFSFTEQYLIIIVTHEFNAGWREYNETVTYSYEFSLDNRTLMLVLGRDIWFFTKI